MSTCKLCGTSEGPWLGPEWCQTCWRLGRYPAGQEPTDIAVNLVGSRRTAVQVDRLYEARPLATTHRLLSLDGRLTSEAGRRYKRHAGHE